MVKTLNEVNKRFKDYGSKMVAGNKKGIKPISPNPLILLEAANGFELVNT